MTLYVDGEKVGEGRVERTVPMVFSADETHRRRHATARTPVSDDYGPDDSAFTGRVRWVQIDVDEAAEDLDHLITPGGAPARSRWRGSSARLAEDHVAVQLVVLLALLLRREPDVLERRDASRVRRSRCCPIELRSARRLGAA